MKHDWQSIPVPGALAERPRDVRGFPITFVTLIQADGQPDFRTIDGQKIVRCVQEGLCGMCGDSLLSDVFKEVVKEPTAAFIGGPLSIENRNFLDPPMHEWCAAYAMQVCPHIAIDTSRYGKVELGGPEGRELFTAVSDERPERFGMLVVKFDQIGAASYQGQPVFLVDESSPIEVRWQDEPQLDEDGVELVPYWETRHYVTEEHEHDGEPCMEMTIVTTGRHRVHTSKELLVVLCPGCNVGVKLNRVTDPNLSEED